MYILGEMTQIRELNQLPKNWIELFMRRLAHKNQLKMKLLDGESVKPTLRVSLMLLCGREDKCGQSYKVAVNKAEAGSFLHPTKGSV